MAGSLDDDDDAATLMPRVAKLIREDHSSSLESSRQSRAHVVFRDVANRFLRERQESLRTYSRRNVLVSEKENLRPKASTLSKQNVLPVLKQKLAMRDASKKVGKNRSVVKLGQRRTVNSKIQGAVSSCTTRIVRPEHAATVTASLSTQGSEGSCYVSSVAANNRRGKVKLFTKNTPLSLSELQQEFAQLDEEALEEDQEVSVGHLAASRPVLAPKTVLQHADDFAENVVSRNVKEREVEVAIVLNCNTEEDPNPNYTHGQRLEGPDSEVALSKAFVSSRGSKRSSQFSSPVAALQQLLHRKSVRQQQNVRVDQVEIVTKKGLSACPTLTKPLPHCGVVSQYADGDARGNVKYYRDGGNLPHVEEDPGSPSVNRMEDIASQQTHLPLESISVKAHREILTRSASQHSGLISADSVRVGARGRTAATKTSAIPFGVSAQAFSTKGTVLLASENAESSCNNIIGHSPSEPNKGVFKETTVDGPDGNASNREDVVHGHKSKFRGGIQSAPPKAKRPSKQEGVSDVRLKEGTHSTRGTSATPPRNPLKLACRIHYKRTRRTSDMSQRRLVFDSSSGSLSRQKVVDRNTHGVSVSSVEFKSKTNPPVDVLIPDIREDDVNMTSIPLQAEGNTLQVTNDDEVTSPSSGGTGKRPFVSTVRGVVIKPDNLLKHEAFQVVNRGCTSQSAKSKGAAQCEENDANSVAKEIPTISGSREQDQNNPTVAGVTISHHVTDGCALIQKTPVMGFLADHSLPAVEASKGVVGTDPHIDSLGPQAGPATEVTKTRKICKRTWSNLGDPIDGGSDWKKGRRVSTRIKSRPLDWWRGERMLYGRVHRTLCTLIGIKTTSPDPTWPRPKPQRGDYNGRSFHVDSFVDESHRDLLRLAAQ